MVSKATPGARLPGASSDPTRPLDAAAARAGLPSTGAAARATALELAMSGRLSWADYHAARAEARAELAAVLEHAADPDAPAGSSSSGGGRSTGGARAAAELELKREDAARARREAARAKSLGPTTRQLELAAGADDSCADKNDTRDRGGAKCEDTYAIHGMRPGASPPAPSPSPPAPGLGSGLEDSVTSRHSPESHEKSPSRVPFPPNLRVADALSDGWRVELERRHDAIARAALTKTCRSLSLWHYHASRAANLARRFGDRVDDCGSRGVLNVWCKSCGQAHEKPAGCGLRVWCPTCGPEYAKRQRRRVVQALGEWHRRAMAAWNTGWHAVPAREADPDAPAGSRRARAARPAQVARARGKRPDVCMLSLTIGHSGDIALDREDIRAALPNLRRRLHEWNGGAFPYVVAWELADGDDGDGLGHVHVHIAACLGYVDVRAIAGAWQRLTVGRATPAGVDMSTEGKANRRGDRVYGAESAAKYVAKYAGKGVQAAELRPELAAAWARTMHGRRMLHASVGFFAVVPPGACAGCEGTEWAVQYRRNHGTLPEPRGPPVKRADSFT